MASIRFTPQAPGDARIERFRGSGAQAGFHAMQQAGDSLFRAGAHLVQMDRAAKEATERVTAQDAADKFYFRTRQELEKVKATVTANQQEDLYEVEAQRVLDEETTRAAEEYTGNPLFFGQARSKFSTQLRADIDSTRRELLVQQGTRSLTTQADRLIENHESDLPTIISEFEVLRSHAEGLRAGFVIDEKTSTNVTGQALTKLIEKRNESFYRKYPEDAAAMIADEAQHFSALLQPIRDADLIAAKQKGDAAYLKQVESHLLQDVMYSSRPLDDILLDAKQHGLDPFKIEEKWAEHHNRRFTVANHEEVKREKAVKLASDELRTQFMLTASKNRAFDVKRAVEENQRSLTPEDTRHLLDFAKANEKSLKSPEQSDTKTLRNLKRLVYGNPNAASTENAIFSAVEQGNLSRGDYEQLLDKMYANRKELKNEDTARKHQMFNEGQQALKKTLTTTSIMEHDPISQQVTTKWQDRLLFAQFGPEMFAGDQAAFNANPGLFVKKIQAEARQELDAANAEEAFKLLGLYPMFINQEAGTLNRQKVVAAKAEKIIPAVDAERLLMLDQLVLEGKVKWPYKPQPKVEAPPPPPEQSWFQKLFGGSNTSKPAEKSDRKVEKKKNF